MKYFYGDYERKSIQIWVDEDTATREEEKELRKCLAEIGSGAYYMREGEELVDTSDVAESAEIKTRKDWEAFCEMIYENVRASMVIFVDEKLGVGNAQLSELARWANEVWHTSVTVVSGQISEVSEHANGIVVITRDDWNKVVNSVKEMIWGGERTDDQ